MAQNELMMRMILRDKIVSKILYCTLDRAKELKLNIHWDAKPDRKGRGGLIMFWQSEGNVWWGCEPMQSPKADFFELGVKVIDDYWFAGDTGIDKGGYGDKFVLEFDGVKFKLTFEDANLNTDVLRKNNLVDCKKTGNIHDIQHP